ncbi:MAG: MmgE/PrpD family protein [Candidatus Bathyarchaeia archaeon]
MDETRKLAEFIVNVRFEDVSSEALFMAKQCILDGLGVAVAGSVQPIGNMISEYLTVNEGAPKATVLGLGTKTSVLNAAFANGTFMHALDYDDTHFPMIGHPTAPVLPATLVLSEAYGLNGRDLITAFAVGFEVEGKLSAAINPNHWYKGFHATATIGTFGAAAAAAKLVGLSQDQTAMALGLAGSQAAGVKQNLGTMTKPFHAGRAAESGVRAALLAKEGFTACTNIFEGQFGFCRLMVDEYDLSKLTGNLGSPWELVGGGVFFKRYPSCHGTHAMINAMLSVAQEYNLKAEDVVKVDVGMNEIGPEELIYVEPKNALQAKFSAQFCIAVALLDGKAGIKQFRDDVVTRPDIVENMRKVTLYVDEDIVKEIPKEWGDKTAVVKVQLKDGRFLSRRADITNPSLKELQAKFRENAGLRLPQEHVEDAIRLIERLEEVDDIAQLTGFLSP